MGAAVLLGGLATVAPAAEPAFDPVLGQIGSLESRYDPKCHATASRLEDFMYGTPLTTEARCAEHLRQKGFAGRLLDAAEKEAGDAGRVGAEAVREAFGGWVEVTRDGRGGRSLRFSTGVTLPIDGDDLRQYGSIAYALRAVLALQQERLLSGEPLGIDGQAVAELKACIDLVSLSVLQLADRAAREHDERELTDRRLAEAWARLLPGGAGGAPGGVGKAPADAVATGMTAKIISKKLEAYAAYNKVSNQIFARNMQVYFARLSWPKEEGEGKAFRANYIEAVTAYGESLYAFSDARARAAGHGLIREADVAAAAQGYIPYAVNSYEDVVFFPSLPPAEQVAIESYDMDAFRDSGNHWRYLRFALESDALKGALEADPFALELLSENIAQFGVLILRVAGEIGISRDEERLSVDLLAAAFESLQAKVDRLKTVPSSEDRAERILSAVGETFRGGAGAGGDELFEDWTDKAGIDYLHRSSDWLNRLLRSYLEKGEGEGVITVPPAFGGSGVAAEDVDGDGLADVLLLGGRGARLYRNLGDGRFRDITAKSGIGYLRPQDNQPGEMRQPLIADFDNDGHQDILITYVDDAHRLYRGRGDGTFEDATAAAGLGGEGLVGGPATTFDYDNDGLLDVYITYFGNYIEGVLPTLRRTNRNGLPNRLFRNLGGLRFEDVTEEARVGDTGWGQAAIHSDLDGDGLQDLIAGNDFGVNAYYRNLGDGTFKEFSAEIGTDKPSYTMSLSVTDLNGDLRPDIYVSNIVTMNKDEKYVLPNEDTRMKFDLKKLAHLRVVEANDLFLSNVAEGGLRYGLSSDVGRGYSSTGWSWDADFFDFDQDGDDDLYVLNGMNEFNLYSSRNPYFMDPEELEQKEVLLPVSPSEQNVFFVNEGGKLQDRSAGSGLGFAANSRSASYFDLEGDGDLDLVVSNYHGRAFVFRNALDHKGREWIKLRLVGDPEKGVNRDAIGSQVVFRLPDGRTVRREVHGSTGYMSVHPKVVHAGLGDGQEAEVTITWPNGETSKVGSLASGRLHVIRFE